LNKRCRFCGGTHSGRELQWLSSGLLSALKRL